MYATESGFLNMTSGESNLVLHESKASTLLTELSSEPQGWSDDPAGTNVRCLPLSVAVSLVLQAPWGQPPTVEGCVYLRE